MSEPTSQGQEHTAESVRIATKRKGAYDRPSGPDYKEFEILTTYAVALIFCIAAVAMSLNNFIGMWAIPATTRDTAVLVARIILFIELVVLVFQWIMATHNELRLWLLWLEHPIPRRTVKVALFALSVFLGISVSFPHQIVFLTAFMGASFLLNYWTQWLSNDHFRRALKRTRETVSLDETKRKVLMVMEAYWLERPQLARNATMMFFILVSFAFAFAGSLQKEPARTLLQLIAYAILILVILVGEVVILRWRYLRDVAIDTFVCVDTAGEGV